MKIKTVPSSVLILLWMIFLSSSTQMVNSQNTTPTHESVLSGSDYKSEDAVSRVDAIFVGEILQIGGPTLSAAGGAQFTGNQVKVLQVLRGSVNAQISVAFNVVDRANEQMPNAGSSYIFFAKKVDHPDPDQYKAIKLLPATDANVTKVKALIAALPAAK